MALKKGNKMIFKLVSLLSLVFFSSVAFSLEKGDQAPCVSLEQVKNNNFTNNCMTKSTVNNKPVLVEFFSTTCGACIENIPNIKKLVTDLNGKATIRMIALDKKKEKVLDFINQFGLDDIEVAFDLNREAAKTYGIKFTPTMFVINKTGQVSESHIGTLEPSSYVDLVNLVESLQ